MASNYGLSLSADDVVGMGTAHSAWEMILSRWPPRLLLPYLVCSQVVTQASGAIPDPLLPSSGQLKRIFIAI